MRILRVVGLALAAAASIWSATAPAADSRHPSVRIVTIADGSRQAQVRLHDLDLSRNAEIGELERRLRTAVRRLCRSSAIGGMGAIGVPRCRTATLADAQNLMRMAISLARGNETLAALIIERPPPSRITAR